MGFAWSLFFAQSAHEAIIEQHSSLKAVDRITDFAPGRRLKVGGMCHLHYVDNFAALGSDAESITKVKENVRESVSRRGLLLREHEEAGTGMAELLGHVIKAVKGTLSISPKRAWRLRDAMLHASRLRSLSGMDLEVILGRAGFCFLVRRPLLSIFWKGPAPRHEGDRETRHIFCSSLFSDLRRPWSPTVWCVDAAPRGIAAVGSCWAKRLEERWRWKLIGGIGAGPRE